MKKRKMNVKRVIVVFVLFILIIFTLGAGYFFYQLSPVKEKSDAITYEVKRGDTLTSVFEDLEEKGLIRSAFFMKVYSKLVGEIQLDTGEYAISASMGSTHIYDVLKKSNYHSSETVEIVFTEGKNVRDLIKILEENTSIKESEVIETLKNEEYLDSLIDKYWFLTSEIKNKDIYYSLEGYLFPSKYIVYKDSSVTEIFDKMLSQTEKVLNEYKSDIENSGYTVHELLTLASIVELESNKEEARKDIAGVFTNRLKSGWALESCVSTYYAFNINMGERELNMSEINDCSNKYNTRCSKLKGLPVGPIGNPGVSSISSTLNPNDNEMYFFLSDKDGNTYFSKTLEEHEAKGRELRESGAWFTYE